MVGKLDLQSHINLPQNTKPRPNKNLRNLLIIFGYFLAFGIGTIFIFAVCFIVIAKLYHLSWETPSISLKLTVINLTGQQLDEVGLSKEAREPEESIGSISPGKSQQSEFNIEEDSRPWCVRVLINGKCLTGQLAEPNKTMPNNCDVDCRLEILPDDQLRIHFANSLNGDATQEIDLIPYVEPIFPDEAVHQ